MLGPLNKIPIEDITRKQIESYRSNESQAVLQLNQNMSAGIYFLQIMTSENKQVATNKILKK